MKILRAKKENFLEIAKILREESVRKPYQEKYTPASALREIEKLAKNELYACVVNEQVVGFIAARIMPDNREKAYIEELWLKKNFQGKGYGKALMQYIEDIYKKKGVKYLRLVAHKKAAAFTFYNKVKFKEYIDLVFMEKRLR